MRQVRHCLCYIYSILACVCTLRLSFRRKQSSDVMFSFCQLPCTPPLMFSPSPVTLHVCPAFPSLLLLLYLFSSLHLLSGPLTASLLLTFFHFVTSFSVSSPLSPSTSYYIPPFHPPSLLPSSMRLTHAQHNRSI